VLTAVFRNYSAAQIKDLIDADFIDRASDADSLRRLSQVAVAGIESAAQESAFEGPPPDNIRSLLVTLAELRGDLHIYRSDYHETIIYTEPEENSEIYRISSIKEFVYHNLTAKDLTIDHKIRGTIYAPIAKQNERFDLSPIEVDGVDRSADAKVETQVDGPRSITIRHLSLTLPARSSTKLKYSYVIEEPRMQPWLLSFYYPVCSYSLTVTHPVSVTPTLYVFGVGSSKPTDPLEAAIHESTIHEWRYEGWFMRNQGMVLTMQKVSAAPK
jgi:hypothetical protein